MKIIFSLPVDGVILGSLLRRRLCHIPTSREIRLYAQGKGRFVLIEQLNNALAVWAEHWHRVLVCEAADGVPNECPKHFLHELGSLFCCRVSLCRGVCLANVVRSPDNADVGYTASAKPLHVSAAHGK